MSAVVTNGKTTAVLPNRITLPEIRRTTVVVPIIGLTSLLQNKWSEKAKQEMRELGRGPKIKKAKEFDEPQAQADAGTYWLDSGQPGFPAKAFKAAMVGGVRLFGGKAAGLPMTELRPALWVAGEPTKDGEELVPIVGDWEMREDMVRVGIKQSSPRYRNCFFPWSAELRITFVESRIDLESVIRLVQAAGLGGVGEWRPEKTNGDHGMFDIDASRQVEVVG